MPLRKGRNPSWIRSGLHAYTALDEQHSEGGDREWPDTGSLPRRNKCNSEDFDSLGPSLRTRNIFKDERATDRNSAAVRTPRILDELTTTGRWRALERGGEQWRIWNNADF